MRLVLLLGLLSLPLGWHLGWLTPRQDWKQATGWARIPMSDLPDEGFAAPGFQSSGGDSRDRRASAGPKIRWLGHSGFLLRWQGQTLLLDPNASDRCTISRRVMTSRFDPKALGPVAGVLISHSHFDHLDLPTLRSIGRIGSLVVPWGSEGYVARAGLSAEGIISLRVGETTRIGPLEVTAVAAAHNGSRSHPFASKRLAVGYVVRADNFTLYYAGDTGFANPFAAIRDSYHPQLAILPIGAYLPRLPMKYYHLSPEETVEAARILGVDFVIPCHFGTYTLSLDRPDWALPRFAAAARKNGVEWRMPLLVGQELTAASRSGAKGSR